MTSRQDGAFHRQFGIDKISSKEKRLFELRCGEAFLRKLSLLSRSSSNVSQSSSWLKVADKCSVIINGIRAMNENTDFEYETGKEPQWTSIYEQWYTISASTHPEAMPTLSSAIMDVLAESYPSAKIKEYDGFVTHNMIRMAAVYKA